MTHGDTAPGEPSLADARTDVAPVDSARIEAAVLELLAAIGEDPAREGLAETPKRVARAYGEFFAGVGVDAVARLGEPMDAEAASGDLVMLSGIEFRSMCEHHLLPFFGSATIAYVPCEKLIGLGRLPLLVDTIASRPQLQERLTDDIADALATAIAPAGVLVHIEASHQCVSARGPRQTGTTTVTMSARGSLRDAAARAEVIALIGAAERGTPGRDAAAVHS